MESPVATLLAAAAANRSYAGPFAYEGSGPAKTIMADAPCVPMPVMIDVLEKASNHASLSQRDLRDLRVAIGVDASTCAAFCSAQKCLPGSDGQPLTEKLATHQAQACLAQATACHTNCIIDRAAGAHEKRKMYG